MVSPKFWAALNGGWPKEMSHPSDAEAINGVKRMYRHVMGRPFGGKVKVVRHRARRTWIHHGVLIVSPEYHHPRKGWPAIVHDLSHLLHVKLHRGAKPHDSRQARIELELQKYLIENVL